MMELTPQFFIFLFFALLFGLLLGWFVFGLGGKRLRREYEEQIAGLKKDAIYERELTQQRVLALESDVSSASVMLEEQDYELKKRDERLELLAQKLSTMRQSSASLLGENEGFSAETKDAGSDEDSSPKSVKQSLLTSIIPLADEAADAQVRIIKVKDDEIIRLQSQLSKFHETSQSLQEREAEVSRLREQLTRLEGIEAILEQRDGSLLQMQSQMDRLIPFERMVTTLQRQLNDVQTQSKLAVAEKDYQLQQLQSEVQAFSQFREQYEQTQAETLSLQKEAGRVAELEASLKAREQDIERLQKTLETTQEKHQTEFENIRQRLSIVTDLEREVAVRDERIRRLESENSEESTEFFRQNTPSDEAQSADDTTVEHNSHQLLDLPIVESETESLSRVSVEPQSTEDLLATNTETQPAQNFIEWENDSPTLESSTYRSEQSDEADSLEDSSASTAENAQNADLDIETSPVESSPAEEEPLPLYVAENSYGGVVETRHIEVSEETDASLKVTENIRQENEADDKRAVQKSESSGESEGGFFAGIKSVVSSIFSSDKSEEKPSKQTAKSRDEMEALKTAALFSQQETLQSREFQNSFFSQPETAETLEETEEDLSVYQSALEEIEKGDLYDDGYATSPVSETLDANDEETVTAKNFDFTALKLDDTDENAPEAEDFEQPTQMFALGDIAADVLKHASVEPDVTVKPDDNKDDDVSFKETIESMSEEKKNLSDGKITEKSSEKNEDGATSGDSSKVIESAGKKVGKSEESLTTDKPAGDSSEAEKAEEVSTDDATPEIFSDNTFDNEIPLSETTEKSSVTVEDGVDAEVSDDTENAEDAEDYEEYVETPFAKFLALEELPVLPSADRIQLLLQSPTRILLYWSLSGNHFTTLQRAFGSRAAEYTPAVRLTNRNTKQTRLHRVEERGEYWFNDVAADTTFSAEIGFSAPNKPFISILKSNEVSTPRSAPSWQTASDEDFAVRPAQFAEVLDAAGFEHETAPLKFDTETKTQADERTREVLALFDHEETSGDAPELDLLEIRWVLVSIAAGATVAELQDSVSTETARWLAETPSEQLSAENVRLSLGKIVGEDFAQNLSEEKRRKKFSETMRVVGASSYAFDEIADESSLSMPPLFPVSVKNAVYGGSSERHFTARSSSPKV